MFLLKEEISVKDSVERENTGVSLFVVIMRRASLGAVYMVAGIVCYVNLFLCFQRNTLNSCFC